MIDFEKIKRVIMQTIQPLGRFEYDEQKDNKVKGTDFVPEGTREDVSHTSPYGLSQNIPKKTFSPFIVLGKGPPISTVVLISGILSYWL